MNCNQFADKLTKCRTYADAMPLLEAMGLGPAAHTLARTAFNLGAGQESYRMNFLADVIQEAKMREEEKMHEEEKKMHEEEEEEKHTKEEEEKKMHEYEGGESTISSDPGMEHLSRTDKSTSSGEHPDTGFNSPENQMKEALRRAGIPELAINKVLKEMDKSAPTTRQMLEAITATVKREMIPVITELKKHREALILTDKKLKEVQASAKNAQSYAIPMPTPGKPVQETSMDLHASFPMGVRRESLEDVRNGIRELDNAMNNGLLKRTAEPYQ